MSRAFSLLIVAVAAAYATSLAAGAEPPKTKPDKPQKAAQEKKAPDQEKDQAKKHKEGKDKEGKRAWKWPTADDVFKKIDANHDGNVSRDEFKAAFDKWSAMRKHRMEHWRHAHHHGFGHHHGGCCCCAHAHHHAHHSHHAHHHRDGHHYREGDHGRAGDRDQGAKERDQGAKERVLKRLRDPERRKEAASPDKPARKTERPKDTRRAL